MKKEPKIFKPTAVMVIYDAADGHGENYVEVGRIREFKNNDPTDWNIGPLKPLTRNALRRLLASSIENEENEKRIKGFMPKRLIYFNEHLGDRTMVWYREAGPQMVLFTDEFELQSGWYNLPQLVYILHNDKLKVFATKDKKKRPEPSTEMFHAPIFNQVAHDNICWGNVKLDFAENLSLQMQIDNWERAMWGSLFSETGQAKIKGKISLSHVYLIAQDKPFPVRNLMPTGKRLVDIIHEL